MKSSALNTFIYAAALLLQGCLAEGVATTSSALPALPTIPNNNPPKCSSTAVTQFLADPPYSNYFLSTCNVAGQVVVTSPLPSSNLTLIGPRLLAAFPGGNSGIAAFFAPSNGKNGTLKIELVQGPDGNLTQVYKAATGGSKYPSVGLAGIIAFNASAELTLPFLGSIRTIRDFTEGPSILVPEIQDAIQVSTVGDSAVLHRLWLDNITTTELGFIPVGCDSKVSVKNKKVSFTNGSYLFYTNYNYPQLEQLNASVVLNPASRDLIKQQPGNTTSLEFLSYSNKLLAGAWRFLTYFGRDSMIAALLLEPVLSEGKNSAMEAVIGSVLERINRTDGSVCHEETIGDYATYTNQENNVTSSAPSYSYPMVDTYFYLPVVMQRYFLQSTNGTGRAKAIFSTEAGSIDPYNKNTTWGALAMKNAEAIMGLAAPFASSAANRTVENLVHLKQGQIVGNWRDSTYGIGGGRIPYDVNTALMPAALRSIAALAQADIYKNSTWKTLAADYAQIWEDETLQFFEVNIPAATAQTRLQTFAKRTNFTGPDQASVVKNQNVTFHAISLQGYDKLAQVQVMNSDDCFRLFLSANTTTNQTQLTSFLNQSALNVMRPFPAGLLTPVGLLISNPAYGEQPVYAANFSTNEYQGDVVWSWPMAMMAKGFELQLARCNLTGNTKPDFCGDKAVTTNLLKAYNALWDVIDENSVHLSTEMWTWTYDKGFVYTELASLPPPAGQGVTESDIRQLWSLTFLAVTRNTALKVPS